MRASIISAEADLYITDWAAKHMRGLAIVIFAATFLASCVPTVIRHYVPSSETGELLYSRCTGQTHIPRGISFVRNRTRVETALVQYRDTLYLQVLITPTGSTSVQLGEHAAQVYFDASTQGRAVAFDNISLLDPIFLEVPNTRTMEIDRPMVGERLRVGNFEYDRHFWLTSQLEISEAESMGVVLPAFVIDGESVRFPIIRFTNESRAGIGFFNC
jgi:hypothetical protein